MTLRDRIARANPCTAVASNGDRCTRREAHRPDDIHTRGAHSWGSRDLPGPVWLRYLQARDETGRMAA